MLKSILKITLIIAYVVTALIIVAAVFFSVSPGENLIRDFMVNRMANQLGLEVGIERLETNLVSRVRLDRITLLSPTAAGADSLLSIDKVVATYSVFDLITGDIGLETLLIDNIKLNITVDSLGNYNIPIVSTSAQEDSDDEESSVAVFVDSMSLTNLYADYIDRQIPMDINLHKLSCNIAGKRNGHYEGYISADSISALHEGDLITVRELSSDLYWDGNRLTVGSTASIEGLQWSAEASLQLPELQEFAVNTSVAGDPSRLLQILESRFELPPIAMENITVNADASGGPETPEISLSVVSGKAGIGEIDLNSMGIQARYLRDTLWIDTVNVQSMGGGILARAVVSLADTPDVDLRLHVGDIGLSEVWPVVYGHESDFRGNIDGLVLAKGRVNDISGWDVDGEFKISNLEYQGRPADDLDLKITVHDYSSRLTLVHASDTVKTIATLKDGNIEGEFYAAIPRISSLSRFADIPDLKGNLTAKGAFSGSLDNPHASAVLKGNGISYQNFPVDNLSAHLLYRGGNIIIDSLKISGHRPDTAMFEEILGIDSLFGRFEYACEISGSLDHLKGNLSARILDLKYSDYAIDSAYASASVDGSSLILDSLDIHYADLMVQASGQYDTVSALGNLRAEIYSFAPEQIDVVNEEISTDIRRLNRGTVTARFGLKADKGNSLNIDCDTIWIGLIKYFVGVDAPEDGFLDLSLFLEGTAAAPHGNLSAVVSSIRHPLYDIDSVVVAADIDRDHLAIDKLQLFAQGNSISANTDIFLDRRPDGNISLSADSPVSGRVLVDDFDLSMLKPYLSQITEIRGIASANIAWDGTMKDPGLAGWAAISDGRFRLAEDSSPIDEINLRLSISDSTLSIDTASFYTADTPLSFTGAIKYDLPHVYEFSASLSSHSIVLLAAEGSVVKDVFDLMIFSRDFELSVLNPYLTMVDSLFGSLDSQIRITGKADQLEVAGYIKIADLWLSSNELAVFVRSGLADIKFDKTRVDIDSIFAEINGGSMFLRGYLVHEAGKLTDLNLDLRASDIYYDRAEIFSGKLNAANLKYGRRDDQYFLDGDISLGESKLKSRLKLSSILPWARSVEAVEYELPEMLALSRLNVRLRENNNLWIDNNLANIRLKAELGIIGTFVRPNISGLVSVEEGYLIYLDRRFKMDKGSLLFTDPSKLNPDIMLHARTQVTEYRRTVAEKYAVHINVEGALDNLRADIYSDPPLDKPDIVALLTLGTTRSRLAGGGNQGGIRGVIAERASGLSSNRVSGYISDKVTSIFGFDEFTVEGNLFRFDNSWGPRMVASRRISKRIDMTYSTTVGHLNDQGIRLGYRLTPRISIQGETNQAGRSGIDIKYGLRFK